MIQVDTAQWGGNPLDTYQIWEQREILSYKLLDDACAVDLDLVNTIVKHCLDNTNFTWDRLDLVDQALVQKKLRSAGFTLTVYNLNTFPTSSTQLQSIITVSATPERIPEPSLPIISTVKELFLNYEKVILTITLFSGMAYYKFDLFWWALLASCVIANTVLIVIHDGWSHRAITPKNKWLGWFLEYYGYLYSVTTFRKIDHKKNMMVGHLVHHRYFYDTVKDNIYSGLMHNTWFQYLFMCNQVADIETTKFYEQQINQEYMGLYYKFDKFTKFMADNFRPVLAISHIILFLILGFKYYLYFVIMPLWYYGLFLHTFVEWLYWKVASDGRDLPFMYPLILGSSYHNLHHKYPERVIVGPRPLRYINPQYWFVKLFFKTDAEII